MTPQDLLCTQGFALGPDQCRSRAKPTPLHPNHFPPHWRRGSLRGGHVAWSCHSMALRSWGQRRRGWEQPDDVCDSWASPRITQVRHLKMKPQTWAVLTSSLHLLMGSTVVTNKTLQLPTRPLAGEPASQKAAGAWGNWPGPSAHPQPRQEAGPWGQGLGPKLFRIPSSANSCRHLLCAGLVLGMERARIQAAGHQHQLLSRPGAQVRQRVQGVR